MKICYLSTVLVFIILVNYSHQQGFNFNPLNNLSNVGSNIINGGNSNESNGLVGTIRNTTSNLFSRLEGPRDRIVEFVKPAVKSDFSRNVTNVLNSIWNRVQGSNISLIQNPYFKSSIVRPINTTLERLTQITAAEDEHAEIDGSNIEIINFNSPEEAEQFREYIVSSASEDSSNPILLIVTDNEKIANSEVDNHLINKDEITNDDQFKNQQNKINESAETVNEEALNVQNELNKQVEKLNQINQEERKDDKPIEQSKQEEPNEPVKSLRKRAPRFMDSYTMVTPDRMRNFFDRVQENRMRECLGLAICESHCRPHLYGGNQGSFRRFFDRAQSFNLDHQDFDYYVNARRYGQRFHSSGYHNNDCSLCHQRYYCPHERQHLINSFSRMGNFY